MIAASQVGEKNVSHCHLQSREIPHDGAVTIGSLLTAKAVRSRAQMILAAARAGRLAHFALHEDRLPVAADYVVATIRANYPDLRIPRHARWRHFVVEGRDRWAETAEGLNTGADELARIRFDLAVTSVLLDAGSGPDWRWHDVASGRDLARSEGLAIASLEAFKQGMFSSDPARPMRADAGGLMALTTTALGRAFQVSDDNPLAGLGGRVALLKRLGETMRANTSVFGTDARVGGLFDQIALKADPRGDCEVFAPDVLHLLLTGLGPIWPGRLTIDGVALGDTWHHPAIDVESPTRGLIPFHKLSQWLCYSLIEPLHEAGLFIQDEDGLTGLAEYRNGGLFVDLGVITPREPSLLTSPQSPGSEAIVEWRALTVALLDEIAPLIRARLGKDGEGMSLASILEGGTWSAGRRIAAERRAGGAPPITIVSDGSVF